MDISDLCELTKFLYFPPVEFKQKLVDWLLAYDKRPFNGVLCPGLSPDELAYCVELLSAYSDIA
jgi:hypothetical protein